MTVLPDLADVLTRSDTIDLPIRGRVHSFPGTVPVRALLVLTLVRSRAAELVAAKDGSAEALALAEQSVEDLDDTGQFADDVLGEGKRQELIDAGCTEPEIGHVFATLLAWHMGGPVAGKQVWTNPGELQARLDRATPGVAASTTPSPASTSGTRSKAPRGRTSSGTGRRSKPTSPPTTD